MTEHAAHVGEYDERIRRGWCTCGKWRTYDVTFAEFRRAFLAHERAARRAEGRRAGSGSTGPTSAPEEAYDGLWVRNARPPEEDVFARTLEEIRGLPDAPPRG